MKWINNWIFNIIWYKTEDVWYYKPEFVFNILNNFGLKVLEKSSPVIEKNDMKIIHNPGKKTGATLIGSKVKQSNLNIIKLNVKQL